MQMPIIQAENLTKTFGKTTAVNQVNLSVNPGEIYGLVGPDGAGKTTTIRLLCGALQPNAGSVTIADYDIKSHADQAREHLGYLSQRFSLYEDLTVLENLRFFAEVRGLSGQTWQPRSIEILDFVGLYEFIDRKAGNLSGGMKQKLGLATALVHSPQLLLLDEPTGGVDPVTRQDFWQLIIRLVSEQNISVLVSTPYMDEAVRCTRVGFMTNGKITMEDRPQALIDQLQGKIVELRGQPLVTLRKKAENWPFIKDVQSFGDRVHLRVEDQQDKKIIKQITQAIEADDEITLQEISIVKPDLEDVFIAFLQQHMNTEE